MSWYTNFFVRDSGDTFIEIASFSRNFPISHYFPHSPVEKIRFVEKTDMNIVISHLKHELTQLRQSLSDTDELDKKVGASTGMSREDKILTWSENDQCRAELNEEIEDLLYALHVAEFMSDIPHLYVGDEISDPTVDDVVEDDA